MENKELLLEMYETALRQIEMICSDTSSSKEQDEEMKLDHAILIEQFKELLGFEIEEEENENEERFN